MTREEILAMEAGPLTDAYVAQHVMGQPLDWLHSWADRTASTVDTFECRLCLQRWNVYEKRPLCTKPAGKPYTADIAAAWEVLEKVRTTARGQAVLNDARRLVNVRHVGAEQAIETIENTSWAFEIQSCPESGDYFCAFEIPGGLNGVFAKGPTAALAICRAALLTTLENL